MVITFFDQKGLIYQHTVPHGQNINAHYYCDVLKHLRRHIWEKRPGLAVVFHQDNAPAHKAKMTQDLLRSFKWEILEHPSYSPNLAPCDFYLFPQVKKLLKGYHFKTEAEVRRQLQAKLKVI